MPFSSFRDRLGSSSKHERSLQQPVAQPSVPASDGTESITTTRTSSTGDSSSSTAVQALMTQPLSADPVQFVQDAITPFFTYNPKHDTVPLDDVLEFHVPRYFAPQYRHNFNLMNTDVGGESQYITFLPSLAGTKKNTCHFVAKSVQLSRQATGCFTSERQIS